MKKTASTLLFATLIALPLTGCLVSGRAHVSAPVAVVEVDEAPPPPPPRRVVVSRPGFVYIEGRHVYRGGRYVWVDGRYERARGGQRWVDGHWTRGRRGHVWVEGHWTR
ncbi:MAG: YXWGXW repeat-containing protein [Kofleriaceae bacterium]